MGGRGRVAGRRYCCFCEACCLALDGSEGALTLLLDIPNCKRCHLSSFKGSEQVTSIYSAQWASSHQASVHPAIAFTMVSLAVQVITCTAAKGIANQKTRAKALWAELKRVLNAGKHAAVQARALWSSEEKVHLRPGHFWPCELGNFDGKGSPIIHTFTQKNESFTLSDGRKMRGDAGECLLLIRCYFHRTIEDTSGLTFKQEQGKKGELLVVNSSELRAVQGHQKNDFVLRPINPPKLREKISRSKKQESAQPAVVEYSANQKFGLDPDIDQDTRTVCEGS